MPLPVEVGGPIIVESEMNIAFGVVRYCGERSLSIFHAGVELHHVIDKAKGVSLIASNGTRRRFGKMMSFLGLNEASRNKRTAKVP
jgi:hypothetical protein